MGCELSVTSGPTEASDLPSEHPEHSACPLGLHVPSLSELAHRGGSQAPATASGWCLSLPLFLGCVAAAGALRVSS